MLRKLIDIIHLPSVQGFEYKFRKDSTGIVMPVPGHYFKHALFLCQSFRKYGCDLPIQIWQAGKELTTEQESELAKTGQVSFHNILDYISGFDETFFRGFQMKPLSLIFSDFQHTLVIDADIVFLQNPEKLFSSDSYLKFGTIFWHDRPLPNKNNKRIRNTISNHIWFKLKVGTPSNNLKQSDFWNAKITENQESGAVYYDKSRHKKSLEKLYQLNMNYKITYQFMHGDKETFWLSSEMAGEPYYFQSERRAQMGGPHGHILHSDEHGIPLWFQHGMGLKKNDYPIIDPEIAWVNQDSIYFGNLARADHSEMTKLDYETELLKEELLENYQVLEQIWKQICSDSP